MARLHPGVSSMPQDIRISPDGSTFYVAMLGADQIGLIDWRTFSESGQWRLLISRTRWLRAATGDCSMWLTVAPGK